MTLNIIFFSFSLAGLFLKRTSRFLDNIKLSRKKSFWFLTLIFIALLFPHIRIKYTFILIGISCLSLLVAAVLIFEKTNYVGIIYSLFISIILTLAHYAITRYSFVNINYNFLMAAFLTILIFIFLPLDAKNVSFIIFTSLFWFLLVTLFVPSFYGDMPIGNTMTYIIDTCVTAIWLYLIIYLAIPYTYKQQLHNTESISDWLCLKL